MLKVKHLYSVGRRERWGGSVGVSGLDLIEKTPPSLMLKRGKGRRNNICIYIYILMKNKSERSQIAVNVYLSYFSLIFSTGLVSVVSFSPEAERTAV